MDNRIEQALSQVPFIVLDGAFGTELAARGFNTCDALWSAKALFEAPDLVRAVHRDYYLSGADVCTSASYQASVAGFCQHGFSRDEAIDLIRRSVQLLKQARDEAQQMTARKQMTAASIGPYGAYLADGSEYTGRYRLTESEMRAFHRERIGILAETAPDLFALETIPRLDEALAIMKELEQFSSVAAWVSFSCCDAEHISSGERIRDCARELDAVDQVAAIGINCTAPCYVEGLIHAVCSVTAKPVVVYANTGETYNPVTKSWHGLPEAYVDFAQRWYQAGARLIGGCCRTTPKHIAEIASWRHTLMKQ